MATILAVPTVSFGQETQANTRTAQQESGTEQELKNLREWIKTHSDKIATTTRAEWPTIKSDFARHANKIENGFQNLSEESKREFLELKTRFQELESKPMADEVPLQAEEVKLREKDLLGKFTNIQTIKPTQLREAYLVFIQNVRDKRKSWTARDWDYADYILQKLTRRRDTVESKLTTLDNIKIRTLIGEFHTLRSGQEFKERQKTKNAQGSGTKGK
ncbi:hypothetical protein [Rufibacter sp. LB8]|uniref:hypothetical protein n=1 Tax=Rufibacter sp. LB8 TaxID=2777781 RepID=UPI00178CC75B|nr:hypothetical protein [Rufibacter sp. LB8]